MSLVSVHLPDKLLKEIDNIAHILHMGRTDYILSALKKMNRGLMQTERKKRLKRASLLTRHQSKAMTAEFEAVEYDVRG